MPIDLQGATVLQVLPSLSEGGVERGTVEIARAITEAGGRALVASAGGRLASALERDGATHRTLPLMSKDPVDILLNARRLRRLVREEGVGLVHARSRAPAWSAWLACRREHVPFVTTWHGVHRENLPGKRLYNAVMARGERVIAISDFVADRVARDYGVGADRLRTIHRGADLRQFDPALVSGERMARLAARWRLPEGARVVMLAGRLVGWKGHAVLLQALARAGVPDAVAVFVGDTGGRAAPVVARLCAEAEALGIASRVRMVGHCDEMAAAYALADIVVAPSLRPEPFGRTVVEAQAMRRLVIVSDAGGAAETVRHAETGWRVPPGDAEALSRALAAGLALPADALALFGENARRAVEARFSTRRMQQATLAVYAEVLGLPVAPEGGHGRAADADGTHAGGDACGSW